MVFVYLPHKRLPPNAVLSVWFRINYCFRHCFSYVSNTISNVFYSVNRQSQDLFDFSVGMTFDLIILHQNRWYKYPNASKFSSILPPYKFCSMWLCTCNLQKQEFDKYRYVWYSANYKKRNISRETYWLTFSENTEFGKNANITPLTEKKHLMLIVS